MPMKVIVCFDEVRVTVPCGDGDIPVSELITKAIHRYKRATGKGSDISVSVTSLKTISGGGILDPDDQLNDVVDDREQLIAEFDEPGRVRPSANPHHHNPYHLHNGGDPGGTTGTASSCSTGAISPDVFQSGDTVITTTTDTTDSIITIPPFLPPARRQHHNSSSSASSSTNNTSGVAVSTDVVVTPRDLTLGSNLRVRRGSDPGLNILDSLVKEASTVKPTVPTRPSITRRESVRESDDPKSESSEDEKRLKMAAYGSLDRKRFSHKFTRDNVRASLSNRPEMARWIEAQGRRMEVAALKKAEATEDTDQKDSPDSIQDESRSFVTIQNDGGPLGIHAVPAYDNDGKAMGLLIQSVEPGRPVDRDGRIFPNDIVVEINGSNLYDVPFLRAQDMFRSAMQSSEINLTIEKGRTSTPSTITPTSPHDPDTVPPKSNNKSKQRQAPPPPVMPKPRNHIPNKPSPLTLPTQTIGSATNSLPFPIDSNNISPDHRVNAEEENEDAALSSLSRQQQQQQQDISQSANPHHPSHHHHHHHSQNSSSSSCSSIPPSSSSSSKQQQPNGTTMTTFSSGNNSVIKPGPPIRPPKKAPAPAIPSRSPKTSLTTTSHTPEAPININALTNTRRIGKRITIQLKKGLLGLGFSVTSRDNQTDGECPIYIRNILPKGAAIQDGRLRIGDRLLEVNGVEMTGKNQAEAVTLLRLLPEGSMVDLVVSRQEEVDERFKVPRPLESNGNVTKDSGSIGGGSGGVATSHSLDTMGLGDAVDLDDVDALSTSQPTLKGTGIDLLDSPPGFTKEKITLRIPLNDTGSAGLGVSVKGKTQTKESGIVEDLGIFIKTVLQGGAASKDGRLQINDQLLEVNEFNLVGLTNTAAMEALRSAMMDDNQNPGGFITLSVARYSGGGTVSPSIFQYGDSFDHSHSSYPSHTNGAIFHRRSSSSNDSSTHTPSAFMDGNNMPSPIPPIRSKRVGQLKDKFNELSNAIRNESYTKATHESLNDSSAFTNVMPPSPSKSTEPLKTKNSMSDNDDKDVYAISSKMQRPHSTIGFLHGPKISQSSVSDDEAFRRASTASSKDDSDLSPQGDLILPFAREGFGRQSMSEKRKGHIDPRSTEVYKQAKANKENKGGYLNRRVRSFHVTGTHGTQARAVSPKTSRNPNEAQSLPKSDVHDSTYHPPNQPSPSNAFNLKRSSSVEDLSHPVQHSTERPPAIPPHPYSGNGSSGGDGGGGGSNSGNPHHQQAMESSPAWQTRFGRARACNDSFRAAVDRSYDIMDPNPMDTLEEESLENSGFNLDPSFSGRSSISSEDTNSLKRQKGKDKDKKTGGGLFKGFLRFGKGRKSNEEALRRSRSEERSSQKNNNHQTQRRAEHSMDRNNASSRSRDVETEHGFYPVVLDPVQPSNPFTIQNIRGRRASQQENERIEEEYARLREHHVSEQRLRSQSVDPSSGRNVGGGAGGFVVYPDRASPFQPYVGPGGHYHQQQVPGDHHGNNVQQDPRLFHPAAMAQNSSSSNNHHSHPYNQDPNDSRSNIKQAVLSRAEKIQQLRTMYQQKHRQREGVYPLDDTEEKYERQIQQLEQKWATSSIQPDIGRHDSESPLFFERNRQNERGHPSVRSYGSSSSMTNINSNNMASSSTTAFNHKLHYTHSNSSGSSSSNRQPRSRPQSRGATGGTFPREGAAGSLSSYYQQDNSTIVDSHQQFYHQQSHPYPHHLDQQQQQHQQFRQSSPSSYYPSQQSQQRNHQQQHHHLSLPHAHSSRVNSSQEEITSFSGGYDNDDLDNNHSNYHHHHYQQQHHSTRNSPDNHRGNRDDGGSSTGPISIPHQQRFRTSPTPQFLSSSLPYPSHHHYKHHSSSNHPDPAKV